LLKILLQKKIKIVQVVGPEFTVFLIVPVDVFLGEGLGLVEEGEGVFVERCVAGNGGCQF